jgi:hypothetical protein
MTRIAILPEPAETGKITYRAISGRRQSVGRTAGEALDALSSMLPEQDSATMVIVQHQRPDLFFTSEQRARLDELMAHWRAARDGGTVLSIAEQSELDELVEAELSAATRRAAALLREFEQ